MSETEKSESGASPARKAKVSNYIAKVMKKAAQIADLMTGEDVEADLKVLRDAKKATHHFFDTGKRKMVKVPDHKTRLAATTLSRAYHEGKPVERSVNLHATGDFEDLAMLLAAAQNSPEAMKQLQGIELPALPESSEESKDSSGPRPS